MAELSPDRSVISRNVIGLTHNKKNVFKFAQKAKLNCAVYEG